MINIERNKEKILELLKNINRKGISKLIEYINNSDYFTAPASTKYHLNITGGLAEHSLNVYNNLKQRIKQHKININEETIIICGILHDICKVNFYIQTGKNTYKVEDQLPIGHGEKSIFIINKYIELTKEEIIAIRYHMGAYDRTTQYPNNNSIGYNNSLKEYELTILLHTADIEATWINDKEKEENII